MSGNVGAVAFETELNAVVYEYLEFCEYTQTSLAFEDECLSRGKHLPAIETPRTNQKTVALQNEMLQHVRKGNRKAFFEAWEKNIPLDVRNSDLVAQKLEFNLHMYFAVYSLKNATDVSSEESMTGFKKYLETKGAVLSQTTEFLPFYALPYVQNPKSHPTYKQLFSDLWSDDVQVQLEKFLAVAVDAVQQPRLFDLYKNAAGRGEKESATKSSDNEQKLREAEKRAAQYIKRHNKVQADYHNLIGITAELVDALEATLQGKEIAPDFLQDILSRLFSRQTKTAEWDLSRPGTAGAALRQTALPAEKTKTVIDVESYPANLDYGKMKIDLVDADSRTKARLLQALRWRLTRCPPGDHRAVVLRAMIDNDVLGCTRGGAFRRELINILRSKEEIAQQSLARLLNALASFYEGRKYLTQNKELISTLMDVLRNTNRSDPSFSSTTEHLLATLQKLSLRRIVQDQVIEGGLLEWLVNQLEDHDALSDYALEYCIALLMNLCLRSAGKQACVPLARKTVKVLSSLLGHQNTDIVPYVNGAIYSVLSVPAIREEARRVEFEETLRLFMKDGTPDNNRQLEYIIKQLNSAESKDVNESDEDEQDEEFDDAEQDGVEPEIEKGDILKTQGNETSGERMLLTTYYSAAAAAQQNTTVRPRTGGQRSTVSTANVLTLEDAPLHRPVTPGGVRNLAATGSSKSGATTKTRTSGGAAAKKTSQAASRQSSTLSNRVEPKGFETRPKIPRTPDASTFKPVFGATGEIGYSSSGATSPKHGLGDYKRNSPPSPGTQPPPRPLYSDSEPRPTSANSPSSSGNSRR